MRRRLPIAVLLALPIALAHRDAARASSHREAPFTPLYDRQPEPNPAHRGRQRDRLFEVAGPKLLRGCRDAGCSLGARGRLLEVRMGPGIRDA